MLAVGLVCLPMSSAYRPYVPVWRQPLPLAMSGPVPFRSSFPDSSRRSQLENAPRRRYRVSHCISCSTLLQGPASQDSGFRLGRAARERGECCCVGALAGETAVKVIFPKSDRARCTQPIASIGQKGDRTGPASRAGSFSSGIGVMRGSTKGGVIISCRMGSCIAARADETRPPVLGLSWITVSSATTPGRLPDGLQWSGGLAPSG